MNDSEFLVVREWHHRLADLSPEAQRAALEESALQPELRSVVENLLAIDPDSDPLTREFFEDPHQSPSWMDAPPAGALSAGHLLCDRYEVDREIGSGGFSTVYLARDTRLDGRPVVIKLLPARLLNHRRLFEHYEGEVSALSQLHHPNLVSILDTAAHEDPGPLIVLEYIQGVTLRDYLKQKRKVSVQTAIVFVRQIASALEAAHERGIWHLDLKPENILIERPESADPRVVVIDFGIAQLRREVLAETGAALHAGSPHYMAPEQFTGKPSAQSDIYAIGVIAHEMLTGKRPKRGHGKAPSHVHAVAKAMAVQPADRFASSGVFAEEFQAELTPPAVDWRQLRQTRRLIWLASAVMLAGIATGTWLLQQRSRSAIEEDLEIQSQILVKAAEMAVDTPDTPSSGMAILDRVIDRVSTILRESGPHPMAYYTLAMARLSKAGMLGHPGELHMGRSEEALAELKLAVETADHLYDRFPEWHRTGELATETRDGLATLFIETGRWDEAEQVIREAIRRNQIAQRAQPQSLRLRQLYGNAIAVLSRITRQRQDWEQSLALRTESIQIRRQNYEAMLPRGEWGFGLDYAGALALRGYLHRDMGNWDGSLADYAQSCQVLEREITQHPGNYRLRFWLARNRLEEGKTLLEANRNREAQQRLEVASTQFREFTRYQNPEAAAFRYLALALSHLAVAKRRNGEAPSEWEALQAEAEERILAAAYADPLRAEAKEDAATIRANRSR